MGEIALHERAVLLQIAPHLVDPQPFLMPLSGFAQSLYYDLGLIIYFAEDEGLRDIVVLNPEWLTRAISYVLVTRGTRLRRQSAFGLSLARPFVL